MDNETPLTIAASKGHKEIFFLLLGNGATLHLIGYDHEMTSDPNGERFEIGPEELLVEAIIGRNVEICNYLLSHIDVNIWASIIPRYLKNEEFRDLLYKVIHILAIYWFVSDTTSTYGSLVSAEYSAVALSTPVCLTAIIGRP